MRLRLLGALVFLVSLLSVLFVFLFTSRGITGAVVLQQSVGFVQEKMIASLYVKFVSVFSIVFCIVVFGMLTLGIFYRAKTKKYKQIDQHLKKEINYLGLCEEIEKRE